MSDAFVGEIRIFAGNFAPRSWAFCDGQLLQIAQNTALFSLVGTIYGGDGRTTFALPDLMGRAPMHPGTGPGLTPRQIGEQGGAETETLSLTHMTSHNHSAMGSTSPGNQRAPAGHVLGVGGGRGANFYQNDTITSTGTLGQLGSAGGDEAHNNMQPFLTLNYIIALVGIFPSRS